VDVPITVGKTVTVDLDFQLGMVEGDDKVDVQISYDLAGKNQTVPTITRKIQDGKIEPIHQVIGEQTVSSVEVVATAYPSGASQRIALGTCSPDTQPIRRTVTFSDTLEATLSVGGAPCGFKVVVMDESGKVLSTKSVGPNMFAVITIAMPKPTMNVGVKIIPDDDSLPVTQSVVLDVREQRMINDWYKGSPLPPPSPPERSESSGKSWWEEPPPPLPGG